MNIRQTDRLRRPGRAEKPRSLVQRIMVSFALLVTFVAGFYAVALHQSMEFTESHLLASFLEDALAGARYDLDKNITPTLPADTHLYGAEPLPPPPSYLKHGPLGYSEVTDEAELFVFRSTWRGEPLILTRDQQGFEEVERSFQRIVIISVIAVFALGLLAGWWLSKNIMKPVKELSAAVRQASASPVYRPLSVTPADDEVGELARICDQALKRLHEALEREKAFTGDVSHELRTPLTVIETGVELLEMTTLTPEQSKQLERVRRASVTMRELVTLFLAFARLSDKSRQSEPDTLDGVLRGTYETWEPFAAEKGLELRLEKNGSCPGTYSPLLLGTVVGNLVKNAVSYTAEGSVAIIETAEGFEVKDTGPGLSPDEIPHIFDAGMRGSSATGDGAGLGLSIAMRICRRLGWQIQALPSEKGAHFQVCLAKPPAPRADRRL
ncbi:MAG: HAMP domain-containing histidine kinase [Sutterella sp.]|nr:HAMP domain-containing histidine kinase [Sutterella sp.]